MGPFPRPGRGAPPSPASPGQNRPGPAAARASAGFRLPPPPAKVPTTPTPSARTAGGDLTLRHGSRSASPGLVDLATATRTGVATGPDRDRGEVLSRCAQPIRLGDRTVEVVLAPSGGAQTRVALSVLARPGHGAL